MSAKRFLKWQLSALMVLIWLGVAAAQSGAPYAIAPSNPYQSSIQQAQALVDSHRAVVKIPGMSVSVAVHGKIVWSQGFGLADVENRTMEALYGENRAVMERALIRLAMLNRR